MKLISKSSTTQRIIALAVLFAMVIGLVPFNSMSVSAAAPFPNGKEPMKYGDELTLTDDGVLSEADKAKFVEIAGSSRPTYPAFGPYTHGGCYDTKGNSSTETRCQNCDAPFSYKIAANGEWYYLGVNDNSNWTDWTTKGNGAVLEKGSTLATGDGSFKAANANKSAVYFFSSNASDEEYIYFYVTKNVTFDVRWESESGYAHCNINGPGIYRVRTVAKNGKFNDIWLGAPSIIHTHDMTYEVVKTVAVKDVKGEYTDHKDSVNAMTGDTVQYKVEVTATCENCNLENVVVYLDDTYIPVADKTNGRYKMTLTKDKDSDATFTGVYTYEHTIRDDELNPGATSFTNTVTVYPSETGEDPIKDKDGETLTDDAVVNIVTEPGHEHKLTYVVVKKVALKDESGNYTDYKKIIPAKDGATSGDIVQFKVTVTAKCVDCDAETVAVRLDDSYIPNGKYQLTLSKVDQSNAEFFGEYTYTYTITDDDVKNKSFKNTVTAFDENGKQAGKKDSSTVNVVKPKPPVVTDAKIKVTKEVKSDRRDNPPKSDKFTVTLYDKDKKEVDNGEITANGNITFDITNPGTYYLKETGMPSDYYEFSRFSGDGTTDSQGYRKLVIAPGSKKTVAVTVTNKYEPPADGALTVTKKVVDLDGVEITDDRGSFSIQLKENGTNKGDSKTVDAGGSVTFDGLVYGRTYTVSETPPDGYSLVGITYGTESDTKFVPNAKDDKGEATVTNRKDTGYDGQLTIKKHAEEEFYYEDGKDGTYWEPIVGAEIEFLLSRTEDREGTPLDPPVQFVDPDGSIMLITDSDGNGEVTVTGLPYGTYELTEVDTGIQYDFNVYEGNVIDISDSSMVTVNATNKVPVDKYLGEITVKKTGDAIDGHTFTFTLVGSNLPDGITVNRTSPAIGIGDSHTFEGLPPGTYTITETVPAGYSNAYVPREETVTLREEETVYVDIENELNTFDLTVNKTLTGMPADFNPEDINFTVFDGETLSDAKITRTEKIVILNKEGTYEGSYTFMNLPMGKDYTVREYLNGTQYKPVYNEGDGDFDEGAKTFTKEVLWNNSAAGDCTVEFTNTLIKGEITVEKVDKGGNTITTSEATFQLLDGDVPLKTQSTIDGFATFSGLEIGKVYTLKEIDAPRGYALNEEGVEITLTDEYFEIVERFVNDTANGELTVEKTIEDADGTFKDPARIVNINDMVIQVVVKNEGNAPLYNLKVVDAVTDGDTTTWADYSVSEDLIDGLEVEPDTFDGKLAVGETVTFTYTTTPPEVGDTHADTVTVTGTFETVDGEDTVVEEDSAEAESVDEPVALLSITKLVNDNVTTRDAPLSVTTGSELTFTFIVRNTGNVDLTDIVVEDDIIGELTDDEFDGTLAAGGSYTFTRTLDAPTAGQTHTNVVTAIGFYEDDEGVTRQTEKVTDDAYARTPVTTTDDDIRIRDSSGTYSDITSGGTTETTSGETPSETVEPNYVPTGTPDVYQLMDEDDTPLGYFTPVLREDGNPDNPEDYDWVEVDEDGTPLGIVDIPKDNPKTNDNSFNKIRYIALIASACLALACVVITRKRRATSTNR